MLSRHRNPAQTSAFPSSTSQPQKCPAFPNCAARAWCRQRRPPWAGPGSLCQEYRATDPESGISENLMRLQVTAAPKRPAPCWRSKRGRAMQAPPLPSSARQLRNHGIVCDSEGVRERPRAHTPPSTRSAHGARSVRAASASRAGPRVKRPHRQASGHPASDLTSGSWGQRPRPHSRPRGRPARAALGAGQRRGKGRGNAKGRLAGAAPPSLPAAGREGARRGPGRLATRQEVPRAALSMLSGIMCAGVGSALPAASPARQPSERAGGIVGPRRSLRGGGHPRASLVPRTRAPARRIPLPPGPGASLPCCSSPLAGG